MKISNTPPLDVISKLHAKTIKKQKLRSKHLTSAIKKAKNTDTSFSSPDVQKKITTLLKDIHTKLSQQNSKIYDKKAKDLGKLEDLLFIPLSIKFFDGYPAGTNERQIWKQRNQHTDLRAPEHGTFYYKDVDAIHKVLSFGREEVTIVADTTWLRAPPSPPSPKFSLTETPAALKPTTKWE